MKKEICAICKKKMGNSLNTNNKGEPAHKHCSTKSQCMKKPKIIKAWAVVDSGNISLNDFYVYKTKKQCELFIGHGDLAIKKVEIKIIE